MSSPKPQPHPVKRAHRSDGLNPVNHESRGENTPPFGLFPRLDVGPPRHTRHVAAAPGAR